jgi:hypothetical protein
MTRIALLLVALAVALAGCDSKPPTPAQDAESIKKLEELQKQGSQGEGGKKSGK